MQIMGGRWEVCLGDGSCVLSFLSFPFAFFNLYITGQIRSLGPGLTPYPADSRPEPGPVTLAPSSPPFEKQTQQPRLPSPTLTNVRSGVFAFLRSRSVCLVMLTQGKKTTHSSICWGPVKHH